MTTVCRSSVEDRARATLAHGQPLIPVLLGLCGTGRTTALRRLQEALGVGACQYINIERTATTPERFLKALTTASPFADSCDVPRPATPREAFDAVLGFLASARCPDGAPATFLLDEVMEFRTFESFPGLRKALPETLAVLAASPNRFALTSRYVTRSERALAKASPHFLIMPMPSLGAEDVDGMLRQPGTVPQPAPAGSVGLAVQRLSGGRPAYARALLDSMLGMNGSRPDPLAAMAGALHARGRLSVLCEHCYELRLHRARGYGALKAILDILAESEPLTLTEISLRLGRTPGSTKDYLSWLDDVDLVVVSQKRYRFRDPVLRVWCRLHCRAAAPAADEIVREVEAYAVACEATGVDVTAH